MAVDPAVLTALTNRYGVTTLAQMTQRDNYRANPTIDEDVLQSAIDSAMKWVAHKIGPQDELDPCVQEAVPIFLGLPGQSSTALIDEWVTKWGQLAGPSAVTQSNALAKGNINDRRRWDGNDYLDHQDLQSLSRSPRSSR